MMYEKIIASIVSAPITQLPSILRCVLECCVGAHHSKHRVFKSNADLMRFVQRIIEQFPDPPLTLCSFCNGEKGWMEVEYDTTGTPMGQRFRECSQCRGTGTRPSLPPKKRKA